MREPQPPALIVIDVQRGFDDERAGRRNNPEAEANIGVLLEAWRRADAPLVHVRHRSSSPVGLFQPGTPAAEFKPEATPLEGEPVIEKTAHGAFIGTDLEERLRDQGVTRVAIVGLTTDHCCSTTARIAADLGFETYVVGDAMATFDRRTAGGRVLSAEAVHEASLASLHDEFAQVIQTSDALALPGG